MQSNTDIILNRLEKMSDFQLLRFFDFFSNEVFKGLDTSLKDILAAMPAEQQLLPEILAIRTMDQDFASSTISKVEAVHFARNLLNNWAKDPAYSVLLQTGLEQYKDTEQSADVILAIGAAVSMILLTIGQNNLQLHAFGVSITSKVTQPINKSQVSTVFNTLPETRDKIIKNSKHSPAIALLEKGMVEEALTFLFEHEKKDNLAEVLQLRTRFEQWKELRDNGGYSSVSEQNTEYNKITYSIIDSALATD